MSDNEYPKMLYKAGSEIEVEGHSLDTIVVDDADADAAAKKDGYADLATAVAKAAKAE